MASQEEVAAFILCLRLIWVRRRRRYKAARERDSARSRRVVAFYQRQAQELATISYSAGNTAYTAWQCSVDTDSIGEEQEHTFFDHIVAGWDETEWKRNFRIGRPTFYFLCTAFPNSTAIL